MSEMTAEAFLEYVKEARSKNTHKSYKYGIEKFVEYFGKTANEVLEFRKQDWVSGDLHQKKRFTREIEKYHSWLLKPIHTIQGKPNKAYTINSARNMCLGILQLFRFYEMPVTIPSGSDVSKTVPSTKDFVPTAEQYRAMFKVASDLRAKLIVSMGKELGWRIGDFVKIRKDMIPDLEQEAPLPFELVTQKEDIVAKSFLSTETIELLKQYLPTLPRHNDFLFPSTNGKYIDTDTINRILRDLAEKASIKISKNKRLRFHCFRKRFLTTCADLGIDVNIAKLLCGKDVELSMLTYLGEVQHREAFLRVYNVLKLTDMPTRKTTKATSELEKEVEDLKRLVHGIVAIVGKDTVERARELAQIETMPYHAKEIEREDLIKVVGTKQLEGKQKLSREQLKEYRRIIEENNNH